MSPFAVNARRLKLLQLVVSVISNGRLHVVTGSDQSLALSARASLLTGCYQCRQIIKRSLPALQLQTDSVLQSTHLSACCQQSQLSTSLLHESSVNADTHLPSACLILSLCLFVTSKYYNCSPGQTSR